MKKYDGCFEVGKLYKVCDDEGDSISLFTDKGAVYCIPKDCLEANDENTFYIKLYKDNDDKEGTIWKKGFETLFFCKNHQSFHEPGQQRSDADTGRNTRSLGEYPLEKHRL